MSSGNIYFLLEISISKKNLKFQLNIANVSLEN